MHHTSLPLCLRPGATTTQKRTFLLSECIATDSRSFALMYYLIKQENLIQKFVFLSKISRAECLCGNIIPENLLILSPCSDFVTYINLWKFVTVTFQDIKMLNFFCTDFVFRKRFPYFSVLVFFHTGILQNNKLIFIDHITH